MLIPLVAALKIELQGAQMLIDRQSQVDCGRAAFACIISFMSFGEN